MSIDTPARRDELTSEECWDWYRHACRAGSPKDELHRLWNMWQDQCIKEGKFHTKGKTFVCLNTGNKAVLGGEHANSG